jgi:hypothetical protein
MPAKVQDAGWAKWKAAMQSLADSGFEVGIFDEEAAQIAVWLEFGTDDGHIPERPVFRETFEDLRAELLKKDAHYTRLVGQGKISPRQARARLGAWYAGKLRWAIIRYDDVPNAESTIKKKGFDDPWIDTGHLVNAVNYRPTGRS